MPEHRWYRAIYGVCRQEGIDNDLLHLIVEQRFGKTSLKLLTEHECRELLDGLRQRWGGRGVSGLKGTARGRATAMEGRRDERGQVEHLVNARELALLREAAALRGWSQETLDAFCRRQNGGRALRTIGDLNRVLWALKAMNRRDGLYGKEAQERPAAI